MDHFSAVRNICVQPIGKSVAWSVTLYWPLSGCPLFEEKKKKCWFCSNKTDSNDFLVCMCVHVCSFPNEQCEKSPEPLMSHHFGPCSGVISLDTLDWCFPSSIQLNLHAQSRLHSPHLPLPPQWLKWRWRAEVSYFRQMSLLHGGGARLLSPAARHSLNLNLSPSPFHRLHLTQYWFPLW